MPPQSVRLSARYEAERRAVKTTCPSPPNGTLVLTLSSTCYCSPPTHEAAFSATIWYFLHLFFHLYCCVLLHTSPISVHRDNVLCDEAGQRSLSLAFTPLLIILSPLLYTPFVSFSGHLCFKILSVKSTAIHFTDSSGQT